MTCALLRTTARPPVTNAANALLCSALCWQHGWCELRKCGVLGKSNSRSHYLCRGEDDVLLSFSFVSTQYILELIQFSTARTQISQFTDFQHLLLSG